MTSNRHPQPLCSSPPEVFITAPQPHALTTSQARILSPIIVIPGHSPIITTLTPSELHQFLPNLHIYIEPSLPGIALLSAASVSHVGLEQALRWREADNESYTGMHSNLLEIIHIYQALAFMGNKPTSQNLRPLERIIRGAFEEDFLLEELQHLWTLRHLPFTEKWVDLMIRRLATEIETMEAEGPVDVVFEGRLEADEELRAKYVELYSIFKWIDKDEELLQRWKCVRARMAMEAKRARRIAKMMKARRRKSRAGGKFRPRLESVPE